MLILKLSDKLNLRRGEESIALSNLSIYYTCKNKKFSSNINTFKIPAPTWNDNFELPVGLFSVSYIQDYFEYILKTHGENMKNPSARINVSRIENRIIFKSKTRYSFELLTAELIKLLGSAENIITKSENSKYVPHF